MQRCALQLAASVLPRGAPYSDGFLSIWDRQEARVLSWPDPSAPADLAIFACDLSQLEQRLGLPPLSSCPWAAAMSQRHFCGRTGDALAVSTRSAGQQVACWC